MGDTATTPQKKAVKPKKPASHPKTIDMVIAAITNLKDRKGSSLQAVKKYIGANYKVDIEKMSSFIRRGLKNAVIGGKLVQTTGTGASGRFKLNTNVKSEKKPKQPKTTKKPSAKIATPKKIKSTKKPTRENKSKPEAKTQKNRNKTPSIKPKKSATKKPKAPKKTPTKKPKALKKTPTKKPKAKNAPTKKKAVPKKN